MRINLTQHIATPEQGCIEPIGKTIVQSLLTFDEIPTRREINDRVEGLVAIAIAHEAQEAMIGGAPFLMSALENELIRHNITPMYAFSIRRAVEKDGVKMSIFVHQGFVTIQKGDQP